MDIQRYCLITIMILMLSLSTVAQERMAQREALFNQLYGRSLQLENGDYSKLSSRFNHLWMAYQVDSTQPAVLRDLAMQYNGLKDNERALKLLDASYKHSGFDRHTGQMLLQLAVSMNKWDLAEQVSERLLEDSPDDSVLLRYLVDIYEQSGQTELALGTLRNLQGDARNAVVIFKESQLLLALKRTDEAEQLLESHLADNPGDPSAMMMLITLYADGQKEEKALALLKKAQKQYPTNIQLSEINVSLNALLGNNKAVGAEIMRVATLEDSNPLLVQSLMSSARNMSRELTPLLKEMNLIIDQLKKIYPETDQFPLFQASNYFVLRDTVAAEQIYQTLVEKGTELETPYFYFIEKYAIGEDTLRLRDVTGRALKVDPQKGLYNLYSALLDIQAGDSIGFEKKVTYAMEVVPEGDPMFPQLALLRADLAQGNGDFKTAQKYYEIAVRIPNPVAYNNYAYALTTHGTPEDLNRAEEMASKAVQQEVDNPSYLDTYAWVLYLKEAYPLARLYIERAIEKLEEPGSVYYEHYGDILTALGEYDKALGAWRRALELGTDVDLVEGKIKEILKLKDE